MVAEGVMAAEYHATVCVLRVAYTNLQKPLFRPLYGAASSPIHTMRHPSRCGCVCYDTTITQQRHGSSS